MLNVNDLIFETKVTVYFSTQMYSMAQKFGTIFCIRYNFIKY